MVSGGFWRYLAASGAIWRYLAIYGVIGVSSGIWEISEDLVVSVDIWRDLAASGSIWKISGGIGRYRAVSGSIYGIWRSGSI